MKNKKILITGANGFLGSNLVETLKLSGYKNILTPRSSELNLLEKIEIENYFEIHRPNVVVHLAGDIGGIGYSKNHPADQLYKNTIMNTMIQHTSYICGVEKFVGMGSVCSYPKYTPIPFQEDNLWDGYPEETNAAYGLSKKLMMEQSIAYRAQYGFNAIHLLMINLYGPEDNFSLESSHVIPATIRKMNEAILNSEDNITLWGDGSASREFIYVKDAARAIKLCMEKYNSPKPINIGCGKEITIKQLATKIKEITGFKGSIVWDKSKPNGQPRRCLNIDRLKEMEFRSEIGFDKGLKLTNEFYKKNYCKDL